MRAEPGFQGRAEGPGSWAPCRTGPQVPEEGPVSSVRHRTGPFLLLAEPRCCRTGLELGERPHCGNKTDPQLLVGSAAHYRTDLLESRSSDAHRQHRIGPLWRAGIAVGFGRTLAVSPGTFSVWRNLLKEEN
jgi:hypothetical protein